MREYELYHHGVLGQKWGVRRYQDKSGHLTAAGKARMAERASGPNEAINYSKGHKSSKGAPQDMVSDAQAVNGGARGAIAGYNRDWNCAFCSTAYELRRRGKDVMEQSILKDGDNTRGRMGVHWKAPAEGMSPMGGHAFNYEVKNGKFYLVDSQVGQVLSGKDAEKYMSHAINVEHYRTDNLKMNDRIANKYFVEQKSDIRINTEQEKAYKNAQASKRLIDVAYASHVTAVAGGASGAWPVAAVGGAGFVVGVTGAAATGINAQRHQKKANTAQELASLELEKEWSKENRMKFYATGKEKGRRRKK